jgi:hypothetical protein
MTTSPCLGEWNALIDARRAYNDNEAYIRQTLVDANKFRNLIYQATQADEGDPDYEDFQEIRAWADGVYDRARTNQLPTNAQTVYAVHLNTLGGNIPDWGSSLLSVTRNRANAIQARTALLLGLQTSQQAYDDCLRNNQDAEPVPDEQGDASDYGPAGQLCLAARTGHGHVGDPCRIRLGSDGTCQCHGFRRETVIT